jgi:hypothetical protein
MTPLVTETGRYAIILTLFVTQELEDMGVIWTPLATETGRYGIFLAPYVTETRRYGVIMKSLVTLNWRICCNSSDTPCYYVSPSNEGRHIVLV